MKLLDALNTFSGHFELHITVAIGSAAELARFESFCEAQGARALVIQLAEGATPRQPMLSLRLKGDPQVVHSRIESLIEGLQRADFELLRVKVEAGIHNRNVPLFNREAQGLPGYFEHHLKLRLPADYALAPLKQALKAYGGHLSANALKADQDLQERFVTQRLYGAGLRHASLQLEKLEDFCRSQGLDVGKRVQEYIVYDSHLELDAGWMEA